MNIILLKNKRDSSTITAQQKQIVKYAHHHSIKVDATEIENSDFQTLLEDRKEFKGFLRSLCENDHLLIFDLFTFSHSAQELIKVFECLLKRNISVHIANLNIAINVDSKPLLVLELLSKQADLHHNIEKEKTQGRPKGRMSKSKFDIYRAQVIELLEKRVSVSKISKILKVSRTSLKDYINSRGLKDLVKAKISLLKSSPKKSLATEKSVSKECSLIEETIHQQEGVNL